MATVVLVPLVLLLCVTRVCMGAGVAERCVRPAACEPLAYSSCLGAALPYAQTALVLASDSHSQHDAQANLQLWAGLRSVPRCWEVVQPLLCAVYMPRCSAGAVELPSRALCHATRAPCAVVARTPHGWPDFLSCQPERFPDGCPNTVQGVHFNTTSSCAAPLVRTDNPASWVRDVEGCGLPCSSPLYTAEEHAAMRTATAAMGALALLSEIFTLATFVGDWQRSRRYPAVVICYINACFLVASAGWLAQFLSDARQDITCRHDGTPRVGEPTSSETLSCVIIFVLIYYPLMAAVCWFVCLAYAWNASFRALGTPQRPLARKTSYFHLACWSLPFVLTVAILALQQVDGDSMSGVCFVGYRDPHFRAGFVLAPVGVATVAGGYYLACGMFTLFRIRRSHPGLLSQKASTKIQETIVRLGVFGVLAWGFVLLTFGCHIYDFLHREQWQRSLSEYILCRSNVDLGSVNASAGSGTGPGLPRKCELGARPGLLLAVGNVACVFGTGITMSSWVWTRATLHTWRHTWLRILGRKDDRLKRLHRSHMIAKAFARRGDILHDAHARISLSLQSELPGGAVVGMDLNLDDSGSDSSSWINHVTKMVARRGAILPNVSRTPTPEPSDVKAPVVHSKPHHRAGTHHHKKKRRKKHRPRDLGSDHDLLPHDLGADLPAPDATPRVPWSTGGVPRLPKLPSRPFLVAAYPGPGQRSAFWEEGEARQEEEGSRKMCWGQPTAGATAGTTAGAPPWEQLVSETRPRHQPGAFWEGRREARVHDAPPGIPRAPRSLSPRRDRRGEAFRAGRRWLPAQSDAPPPDPPPYSAGLLPGTLHEHGDGEPRADRQHHHHSQQRESLF
ncbi:protein smoothened [Petromyzon marinus]|uniref:protein smoothened n=1 Tax=Petromyzon marinus TaxID=7757 RepID=UPI003F73042A